MMQHPPPILPPATRARSLAPPGPEAASVWWQLHHHGKLRHAAGTPYSWHNARRPLSGGWVVELVLEGETAFEFDSGDGPEASRTGLTVRAGGVFLFAYGEESWYGWPGPLPEAFTSRWVALFGAGLGGHLAELRRTGAAALAGLSPEGGGRRVAAAMDTLARASIDPLDAAAAAHHFVLELARCVSAAVGEGDRPVERALRFLRSRPCAPLSLGQVADEHGVSREHLARVYRERFGGSPHRWLSAKRVERALELLRFTGLPLREVAQQSGLGTVPTLTRQVRAATGKPPTAVRAEASRRFRPA